VSEAEQASEDEQPEAAESPPAEPPQEEPRAGSQPAEPSNPGAEPEVTKPDAEPSRRRFLSVATACLGACVGAGVLGSVGAALVATPLSKAEAGGEPDWFDLGKLERFETGRAVKVVIKGEVVDAWNRFKARSMGRVLVYRESEGELVVFSSVCPHNGYDVYVREGHFLCPAHDSTFEFTGALKGGESPRGLDPLEHKLVEGRLRVRYQRFAVGTSERKPV